MPRWEESIDLHAVLDAHRDDADNAAIIVAFRTEVRRSRLLANWADYLPDDATTEQIDAWLAKVYDAADERRVWCGMSSK